MKKGDVVLITFPFADLSGSKTRPALVLFTGTNNVIVAFISTNLSVLDDTNIIVNPTYENGLKKESVVRLDKIATLEKELALGLLGRLEPNIMKDVNQILRRLFKL